MKVYVNGRWFEPSQAKVPALNSSFLYGESVYEGIPLYRGKPLFLEDHLHRFERGSRFLGWKTPPRSMVLRVLKGAVERWGGTGDLLVRLGLVQGLGEQPGPKTFVKTPPLLIANARPLRHDPRSCNPPRGKVGVGQWRLPSVHAYPYWFKTAFFLTARREMARHPDWDEMLRLSEDGKVMDGFSSSPLLFKGRMVFSGAPSEGGLESVTKAKVLGFCRSKGMVVSPKSWRPKDVTQKSELVFVGSGVGILSPSALGGRELGPIGPRAAWLWDKYREWIDGVGRKK